MSNLSIILREFIDEEPDDHLNEILKEAADRIEALEATLNYVCERTYCGADAEWHFKSGYDPQRVLNALAPEQDK